MVFTPLSSRDIVGALSDPKDARYKPVELVSLDAKVVGDGEAGKKNPWRYKFSFKINKGMNEDKEQRASKGDRQTLWVSGSSLRDVMLMHSKLRLVRYMDILSTMKDPTPTRRSARLNDLKPDFTEQLLAAALEIDDRNTIITMVRDVEKDMQRLASSTIRDFLRRVKWKRREERPAKRRRSSDTQAAHTAARKKERRGLQLAIDWMKEQAHAGELVEKLSKTWRGEEGYGMDKLLRDPELHGRLSEHQATLLHRKTATLARFYHVRSTAPQYSPRSATAREVEEQMSFGPLIMVPWRTILLWEQEFRDEKYKLVPSVKGRWSRWWILTEPDVKAR
jgi:hypothetical protein